MDDPTTLALVTGAPGWLGSRLVETLRHGVRDVPELSGETTRRVRCLVLPGSDTTALRAAVPDVELVEGDVTRPETLTPFLEGAVGATLFHAAGVVHPAGGVAQLFRVNDIGTASLVSAAEGAGVRRLVHVSSNSPIGVNPSVDHVFDESAPFHPYMGYGRSKQRGEEHVAAAHARGRMETVIIRPPWFYGPGQPARQTLFFEMIRDGKAPIVGGGENRRSMAYVDNICHGLLLCERVARAAGQTYWIADARPYTMNEIIDTVERLIEGELGVAVKHGRLRLPGLMSEVAWVVDAALQAVGLYHQKIHVLSEMNKTIACSIAKAERELGYAPRVALEEGMRRSLAWMSDHGQRL